MIARKLFLTAAFFAVALTTTVHAADSAASQSAAPQEVDPKSRQRIYFTSGNGDGYSLDTEIEYTEEGAVVRFLGEVRMSSRPMSTKEQGLRSEWIKDMPLSSQDEQSDRHMAIEKILARTSPSEVTSGLQPALREALEAWRSPMRFEAIWLDQKHPKDN